MNMTAIRAAALSLAIASSATVAGCSKQADQPDTSAEMALQNEPTAIESEPVRPVRSRPDPAPAPVSTNTSEVEREQLVVPPEAPVSRDAQMLDDAGASGMTARMPGASDESVAADANRSDGAAH